MGSELLVPYILGKDVKRYTSILPENLLFLPYSGKSGDVDHPYPVQSDHPKLTFISCIKRAAFVC